MIELLLEAERAMSYGLVDQAERLYAQAAAADPRNSIAIVGLARVALERGNDAEAYEWARRALAIDPENVAAVRLVARLDEVLATRWMTAPMPAERTQAAASGPAAAASGPGGATHAPVTSTGPLPAPAAPMGKLPEEPMAAPELAEATVALAMPEAADASPEPLSEPAVASREPQPEATAASPASPAVRPDDAPHHRSLLDRLLRRNR